MSEDEKREVVTERSEFSDFMLQSTKKYVSELNIPDDLRKKIEEQELLLVPFGSVGRGNATEESSDLDLLVVTKNSSEDLTTLILDGSLHPSGKDLDHYLKSELSVSRPDLYARRKAATIKAVIHRLKMSSRKEVQEKIQQVQSEDDLRTLFPHDHAIYVEGALNDIEVDSLNVPVTDILKTIKSGDLGEYGQKNKEIMGTWGSIIGVFLNIDISLVISPCADKDQILNSLRRTIKNTLNSLPTKALQDLSLKIARNYRHYINDIKNREE